jgi:general secretion pathway protein H
MSRCGKQSGYTLIELLVVISIIGLIAAIAAPATSNMITAATFRADARSVSARLRKCRSIAIAQQRALVIGTQSDLNAVPAGMSADNIIVTFDNPIRWFADGTTTGGKVTVQRGDREKTIIVAWLTGSVTSEP